MSVAVGLKPDWKQWEGEIVDGQFPLERLLMEFADGALFLTRAGSESRAIKLVPVGDAGRFVDRWSRAQSLEHPHLMRVFKAGAWTRAGATLGYAVTDYADENLAMVLKERALAPGEVSEMVAPLVDTLAFLHEHGVTLGGLEPSRIYAVREVLKISSGVIAGGESAADLRGFAATVAEALTRKKIGGAEPLPEPFAELVRKCLQPASCSSTELARWWRARQGSDQQPDVTAMPRQPEAPPRAKNSFAVFAIFVVIVASMMALLLFRKHPDAPAAVPSKANTAAAASPAAGADKTADVPPPGPTPEAEPRVANQGAAPGQIIHQVLPKIPAKDRQTIHGKATVTVNVVVDRSGHVTEAILEKGGSRYFGRLATEAARQWQFASAAGASPREYDLRFEITRTAIRVVLEKTRDKL